MLIYNYARVILIVKDIDYSMANAFPVSTAAPLFIIRHPVDRAVSQFYYIRKWYNKISGYNLTEFMNDAEMMSIFWSVWFDGQVTFKLFDLENPYLTFLKIADTVFPLILPPVLLWNLETC